MRLTKATDMALRIAMRLAVADDRSSYLTTRQAAAAVEVPYSHAAKVVTRLQHLGVVEARRGRNGGLSLTSFGRQAPVGWLVKQFEGPDEPVECAGDKPCPLRSCCRLRRVLRKAQEAFFATLDVLTLEDLARSAGGPIPVPVLPVPPVRSGQPSLSPVSSR